MKAYETLLFEIKEHVAWITLNRPDKRNSFTQHMHEELRDVLAEVESAIDGTPALRVLVITGSGKGFCAGQDLSERRRERDDDPPPDLRRSLRENYNPLVMWLARLHIPVIAAVNGVAAGAGANLALACDLVIAAKSAFFVQPFCQIGLIPDGGGTWILPQLIGIARAKGLTFLGERLSAEQAAQWGLIWQAVDDDALLPTVTKIAKRIVSLPKLGFELQKRAYLGSQMNSLGEQLELEAELQGIAGHSDDYRKAVAGFFEKHKPNRNKS